MKIAVVHNGNHEGVLSRFGQHCPERYSLRHVQMVLDGLHCGGHNVALLEADVSLFQRLGELLATTGGPTGNEEGRQVDAESSAFGGNAVSVNSLPGVFVFNMAYGMQGDARYTHLPAMLELAGIPYTGSSPLGHALALDKVVTKILMSDAGVPTPAYCVLGREFLSSADSRARSFETAGEGAIVPRCLDGLRYPLVVKPRHESTSYGLRLVHTPTELSEAVAAIVAKYQQDALVEEYIDGREVCIGLLGNDPVEFLPPVELDFGQRDLRIMTWDDKYHKRMDEPTKICPAPLAASEVSALNDLALLVFRACHLRDYARVDIRLDAQGRPFVLEVNSMASLGDGGSYVTAAKAAGYTYPTLVARILDIALQRCRVAAANMPPRSPQPTACSAQAETVPALGI